MRLITDEQHAQIVEALDTFTSYVCTSSYSDGPCAEFSDKLAAEEALAVLQALPEVEVVGYEVWEAMCEPQLSYNKGGIKSLMKKLYATKEPS